MDKLREWKKQVKNIESISFKEVKELSEQYENAPTDLIKREILNRAVNGSIQSIITYIENRPFDILDNGAYDVEDILSLTISYFAEFFASGKIRRLSSLSDLFNGTYYNYISDKLTDSKKDYKDIISKDDFSLLYGLYLQLNSKMDEVKREDFVAAIFDKIPYSYEFEQLCVNLSKDKECLKFKYDIDEVLELFKSIQKNTGNKIDETTFSRNRLMMLQQLLMEKSYKDKLVQDMPEEESNISIDEILNFLRDNVSDIEYNIFVDYYGLAEKTPKTVSAIEEETGIPEKGIRVILARESQLLINNKEKFLGL